MKKTILIIMLALLLIGIISAGIGIGALNEQRALDKIQRDILLTKTDTGEINPNVEIKCSDNYCIYNVIQEGIINSFDNQIPRTYCSEYNETSGECLIISYYTDEEIENMVADNVLSKLENYANAEISREDYEAWETGNVEIIQK